MRLNVSVCPVPLELGLSMTAVTAKQMLRHLTVLCQGRFFGCSFCGWVSLGVHHWAPPSCTVGLCEVGPLQNLVYSPQPRRLLTFKWGTRIQTSVYFFSCNTDLDLPSWGEKQTRCPGLSTCNRPWCPFPHFSCTFIADKNFWVYYSFLSEVPITTWHFLFSPQASASDKDTDNRLIGLQLFANIRVSLTWWVCSLLPSAALSDLLPWFNMTSYLPT